MDEDSELFEAWKQGDQAAGSTLFERHFPQLYAFFRNTAPNGADDLVQRTFLACLEGRDRIKGNFVGYMFGVAKHLLYGEYAKYRKDAAIDFGVTSAHDLAPSPSSMIGALEISVLLDNAMRMIPIDFQVALDMFYIQGLTGPCIAERLDLPEGTVRGRIRRGLGHLRRRIEQLHATPGIVAQLRAKIDTWASVDGIGADVDDGADVPG